MTQQELHAELCTCEHDHQDQPEPPIVAPGDLLAPGYAVVQHLRRGNRLDVYDAWSLDRETRCIAKLVRPDRVEEPHTAVALRREGHTLRDLAHPHLVRAYDVIEEPQVVVVMETLTGPSLGEVLDKHTRLSPDDVAVLGSQLISVLRYLHRFGHIHGDVTPGNVITEGTTAKLIDLSLSGPAGPVRAGVGTRGYRAPEQASGADQSEATDVWGFGAVLHHALTGHTYDEPERWWQRRPARAGSTRRQLMELIDRCLQEPPAARATTAEISAVLEAIVLPREL